MAVNWLISCTHTHTKSAQAIYLRDNNHDDNMHFPWKTIWLHSWDGGNQKENEQRVWHCMFTFSQFLAAYSFIKSNNIKLIHDVMQTVMHWICIRFVAFFECNWPSWSFHFHKWKKGNRISEEKWLIKINWMLYLYMHHV